MVYDVTKLEKWIVSSSLNTTHQRQSLLQQNIWSTNSDTQALIKEKTPRSIPDFNLMTPECYKLVKNLQDFSNFLQLVKYNSFGTNQIHKSNVFDNKTCL